VAKTALMTALNRREEEIARLVASGLSNAEVAQRLSLSLYTVKNHLFHAYEKLGISTRIELLLYMLSHYKSRESEENEIAEKTFKMGA
jgi:DNA-binding NarL/FixJ family response regulator